MRLEDRSTGDEEHDAEQVDEQLRPTALFVLFFRHSSSFFGYKSSEGDNMENTLQVVHRPVVLVDIDGVLADFVSVYLGIVEYQLGKVFRPADVTVWDVGNALGLDEDEKAVVHEELFSPGVAFFMKPYEGAVQFVEDLKNHGLDPWLLTSPLKESPTWCSDRRRWVDRHFGRDMGRKLIFADRKELVAGRFFIDDKPSNLVAWKDRNPEGTAILWDAPYNKTLATNFPHVRSTHFKGALNQIVMELQDEG